MSQDLDELMCRHMRMVQHLANEMPRFEQQQQRPQQPHQRPQQQWQHQQQIPYTTR